MVQVWTEYVSVKENDSKQDYEVAYGKDYTTFNSMHLEPISPRQPGIHHYLYTRNCNKNVYYRKYKN